jgi:hypothetical protein
MYAIELFHCIVLIEPPIQINEKLKKLINLRMVM